LNKDNFLIHWYVILDFTNLFDCFFPKINHRVEFSHRNSRQKLFLVLGISVAIHSSHNSRCLRPPISKMTLYLESLMSVVDKNCMCCGGSKKNKKMTDVKPGSQTHSNFTDSFFEIFSTKPLRICESCRGKYCKMPSSVAISPSTSSCSSVSSSSSSSSPYEEIPLILTSASHLSTSSTEILASCFHNVLNELKKRKEICERCRYVSKKIRKDGMKWE